MLKHILLAATALSLVAGAATISQAADTPEEADRVATELNGVIANANPGTTTDKRAIVIEPSTNATATIPGAETAIVPGAETPANGPAVATATPGAPVVDLVPVPAPNADVAKPQIQVVPAPTAPTNPGIVATAPAKPTVAPVQDGADLYRRLTAQGYRPLQLLETSGKVFSVLVADIHRSDANYVIAVDTTYGTILSIRPVNSGYNVYGGYAAPTPNYGTYGYTYTQPAPAYPYGGGYGYTAPRTYSAPSYGYRY
ncbi:MAG: hypothetical protein U1E56_11715 [Bauldia sp.]